MLAAHLSDNALDYREVDYTRPTALLLGAEKYGVSEAAVAKVDRHVVIRMLGMTGSFNVSVACAIILAEAQRQWAAAGMCNQRRLPDDEYSKLLFEWCHPSVTDYR